MNAVVDIGVIKQHLIDPEICIRCNTCEATCPVQAITHDDRNYVVDAAKCNLCMACVPPCPTGSIDNWRTVPQVKAYTLAEQLGWDALPAELTAEQLAAEGVAASLGHSQATLEQARAGYAAGARTTTHLFNAMTGVDHRAPGLAVAALGEDAAYVELIADGIHVHPALWPLVARSSASSAAMAARRSASSAISAAAAASSGSSFSRSA